MQILQAAAHPWFEPGVATSLCLSTCCIGPTRCEHGLYAAVQLNKDKINKATLGPLSEVAEDQKAIPVLFLATDLVRGEWQVNVTFGLANRDCLLPLPAVGNPLREKYRYVPMNLCDFLG